jgi:hypothetical protein
MQLATARGGVGSLVSAFLEIRAKRVEVIKSLRAEAVHCNACGRAGTAEFAHANDLGGCDVFC